MQAGRKEGAHALPGARRFRRWLLQQFAQTDPILHSLKQMTAYVHNPRTEYVLKPAPVYPIRTPYNVAILRFPGVPDFVIF